MAVQKSQKSKTQKRLKKNLTIIKNNLAQIKNNLAQIKKKTLLSTKL